MSATNRGAVRIEGDAYYTPAWCVDALLRAVRLPGGLWLEPACGDCGGYMRMSGRGVCSLRPNGDDLCRPSDYAGDCRWFLRTGDHMDAPTGG